MRTETDEDIVHEVLHGQRDRYALLVERYGRLVASVVWRVLGGPGDVEELTQEVFVRAYFALPSYKPEYRFSSWLYRIALNLCLDERHRRGRELPLEPAEADAEGPLPSPPDPGPSPAVLVARRETARALWAAVAALPDEFREVVLLRHVDELSYQEICERTGLPMGTVKSRLARARRQLAEDLEGLE